MQRKKLKDFLFKDVQNENETKKGAVLLRLYSMIMCIYLLAVLLTFIWVGKIFILSIAIPCFAVFCLSVYMTYSDRTRYASWSTFVATMLWILSMVHLLGWDCGVQHFLFVLVAYCFILNTRSQKANVGIAVGLCLCRIGLYFYTKGHIPEFVMDGLVSSVLQILNTVTIFTLFVVMIGAFSKDANEMDRKLVVYNEKLKEMASVDPLTGLRNRRSILQYADKCVSQYNKGMSLALSVAIGDIDHFKQINDTYGHENGDIVLRQVSNIFMEFMKGKGYVGRWGGEEFLFVFPGLNGDEALVQLSKLQQQIRNMPSISEKENITVTMTWGLEEYSDRSGLAATINEADKKLYIGKEAGRDRVIY